MIRILVGDLFDSRARTLVNAVNCVGTMGAGVALGFKRRWPDMFEDYRERCARGGVCLGEPYLYLAADGASIINFPTKGHWRQPSYLSYIDNGLVYLAAHARLWDIERLAMPALGCGHGGLSWIDVGPLIYRKLNDAFDVELYAPPGTPANQLTLEFLQARG